MSFFDDLGKTLTDKSQEVAKKAKDVTEVTRLNSQISSEQKKIEACYTDIGRMYYQKMNGNPEPEYAELAAQISQSMANIEAWRSEITRIRKIKKCVNCGAEISADAQFCNMCGAKNEVVQEAEAPGSAGGTIFCKGCGQQLPADAMFCPNCGTKQ